MSKNVLLGKTSSLLDLTDSQDISDDFFFSQLMAPKITNKPLFEEGIYKLPVFNKFSAFTDDGDDSV